jgi:hypothetical protein
MAPVYLDPWEMNMDKRERIITLATEISAMRDKLRILEAEMDTLIGGGGGGGEMVSPVSTAQYTIQKGVPLPKSMAAQVVEFLESNKQKACGVWDIATGIGLPQDKINSLRSTIIRLIDAERIEKVSPGLYRANQEKQHTAA